MQKLLFEPISFLRRFRIRVELFYAGSKISCNHFTQVVDI